MYWVAVRFSDEDMARIETLRDDLFGELPANQYSQEEYPHITIVPGFTTETGEKPDINTMVSDFEPFSITFNLYHMWPSVEEPMVVAMTPDSTFTLSQLQSEVLDWIEDNGSLEYETTPFHSTLCKAGDAGDEDSFNWDETTREKVEQIKEEKRGLPLEVTVTKIGVFDWNS